MPASRTSSASGTGNDFSYHKCLEEKPASEFLALVGKETHNPHRESQMNQQHPRWYHGKNPGIRLNYF